MANISFTARQNEESLNAHAWNGVPTDLPRVLTDVGGGGVSVGELVELPGSHGVHLDERDAAAAPLSLRLVDGEERLEEEVDDPFGDGLGVRGQAGEQVVHGAHIPKLERPQKASLAFAYVK